MGHDRRVSKPDQSAEIIQFEEQKERLKKDKQILKLQDNIRHVIGVLKEEYSENGTEK